MPKIRLNTSCDEWIYGRYAHRQDRADKYILRAVVRAQSGELSRKAFVGSNPCPHQIQNQKIFPIPYLGFQGSNFYPQTDIVML